MFTLLTLLAVATPDAEAASVGLEPQNRFHLGLSMVQGPGPAGVSAGFDSRLTRVVAIDLGLFVTPGQIPTDWTNDSGNYADNFRLRHGVYFMPGLRIPHPQPKEWAWDIYVRGGAGVLWTANLDPIVADSAMAVRPGAGGSLGLDGLVRVGQFGLRPYAQGWLFGALRISPDETYVLVRPHYGIEGVVQW